MNGDDDHPTLRDLACEIGQVQIRWCFLENEMRAQLADVGLREKTAKGPVIAHWRSYLSKLSNKSEDCPISQHLASLETTAKARNLLAHAIHFVSADPTESEAFVTCIDSEGSAHRLTYDRIRLLSVEIDQIRHRTRNLIYDRLSRSAV